MAQKRTSRSNSKTNTKSNTKKRKSTRTRSKKPKVYIPAYKAIILCCAIITVCMGLLLITTLHEPNNKLPDAVIERYKDEIVEPKKENKTEEKKKEETAQKTETSKKADTQKKTEASKKAAEKTEKIETAQKKQEAEKAKTQTPEQKKAENKPAAEKTPAQKTPEQTSEQKNSRQKAPEQKVPAPSAKSKYNFPKAKNNAQLIFVFDDGGQNLSHLAPFLKLPFPITVAVLPQLAHSKETAAQTRASGNEVILHQPMQAVNAAVNPGPGAIKPEMSDSEIKSILFQNVTEIGPIAGMNNHEGSAITADAEKMALVLQFCSQEGIFFLDSRTNVETKVPYVAGELGYSYYERNIFLDNEKTNENALKELKKGLDLANKNGSVIMIGHIWSADFLPAFLQDAYPELKEKGYTFSVVSKSKAKKN